MKLSTKARHAITAMMVLSLNDKIRPITLAEISQSQGISLSYLEKLFAKLRKDGLVVGVRGPGGGYKLARVPNEITIAQIISAIDEYHPQPETELSTEADTEKRYVTHVMWDELSEKIYAFLNSITLAEFAQRTNPSSGASSDSDNDSSNSGIFSALTAA